MVEKDQFNNNHNFKENAINITRVIINMPSLYDWLILHQTTAAS